MKQLMQWVIDNWDFDGIMWWVMVGGIACTLLWVGFKMIQSML